MKTTSLKQTLSDHRARVHYRKSTTKAFIGGLVIGSLLGAFAYAVLIASVIVK